MVKTIKQSAKVVRLNEKIEITGRDFSSNPFFWALKYLVIYACYMLTIDLLNRIRPEFKSHITISDLIMIGKVFGMVIF